MKKVELLAPAGNFEGLKGAIKAGADAVYLGGQLFGARAYADNFSEEEICEAIHMAHVFGKRIYLTVNTLVKEKELDQLYGFLMPFYKQGLDGVIIQDLGVLKYIREQFPELELHASTQMSLSGENGTRIIKEAGVNRIVPARELSLNEIKTIHDKTGIEIEAFIHGAMCYCYSGQCLLSSILGGRSGNRGRCAQPCRLTYSVDGKESCYPLSMRDMCTLDLIPELIEAGISSFKIEGRMKKSAYAAGVTSIYRKYIDLYYENPDKYQVKEEDRKLLSSLYIRSSIGEGYYHRHNGREMITLDSPAYSGSDDRVLAFIEKKYIEGNLQRSAEAEIFLKVGEPVRLELFTEEYRISCEGDVVQKALKQPLSGENITEKIQKSGTSLFVIENVKVNTDGDVFLPVKALNELRRNAISKLEDALIKYNGLDYKNRSECSKEASSQACIQNRSFETKTQTKGFHISVKTMSQLLAAVECKVQRIYIDYDLAGQVDSQWLKEQHLLNQTDFYLTTPYIVRAKDITILEQMAECLSQNIFQGVLIRNLESYGFFKDAKAPGKLILDHNMYLWNRESLNFWNGKAAEFYLPIEENMGEWREILQNTNNRELIPSAMIYGRLPMMISANCVKKTTGNCNKEPGFSVLKDRYEIEFPVYTECRCCYNVIYNSVPISLHGLFKKQIKQIINYRLDFTVEDAEEIKKIVSYFKGLFEEYKEPFYKEFTTGHLKRGVE